MEKQTLWVTIHLIVAIHLAFPCSYIDDKLTTTKLHSFERIVPYKLSEYQNNANITWLNTANPLHCARLTYGECCRPKGFFYNTQSKLCRPVFWQSDGYIQKSPTFMPGSDDKLYEFRSRSCPPEFEEHRYNIATEEMVTCLRQPHRKFSYSSGKYYCEKYRGYIATAKSLEKLALLKNLDPRKTFWVGLTDKSSPTEFRWEDDNSIISKDTMGEIFEVGQPNYAQSFDCARAVKTKSKLQTYVCASSENFFCEVRPGC